MTGKSDFLAQTSPPRAAWRLVALLALTVVSGAANATIIFVVTSALQNSFSLKTCTAFAIACLVYLVARKTGDTQLLLLTSEFVYLKRMAVADRILTLSYAEFEGTERGVFYNLISEDTTTLGNAGGVLIGLATSITTVTAAFVYMFGADVEVALIMTCVVAAISAAYAIRTQQAKRLLDEARQCWNDYVGKLNDLLDGFKELRIHSLRQAAFRKDMEGSCAACRRSAEEARNRLLNAFLSGETLLLAALGCITLLIPAVMPNRSPSLRLSFVVVLLYLIGPVRSILAGIPQVVQLQMAWRRIDQFLRTALPPSVSAAEDTGNANGRTRVGVLEVRNLCFQYPSDNGHSFVLGPVSFSACAGECVFVIGGNGSGKTTLAKVMLGLLEPTAGEVSIDGKEVDSARRGEYFSVVFGPCHVFRKLYDVPENLPGPEIDRQLNRLLLAGRVELRDGCVHLLKLSAGQRKRIAMLECLLGRRPIFLFDEFAADQDPEFRRFFYEGLLPDLKRAGGIVIAITHDEQYFHHADQVLKLELDGAATWSTSGLSGSARSAVQAMTGGLRP